MDDELVLQAADGVRDSSSESEGQPGQEDTHDEDSDDHMLMHGSNFSVTEVRPRSHSREPCGGQLTCVKLLNVDSRRPICFCG